VSGSTSQLEHRWFGLTRSQLLWAITVRVIVAATAGTVVFATTGSVIWLIVALLTAGVVVNALSGQGAARRHFDHPSSALISAYTKTSQLENNLSQQANPNADTLDNNALNAAINDAGATSGVVRHDLGLPPVPPV
jgi:hypothetical protein